MSITDDTREFVPGHEFRNLDETTLYWIRDGKIMYRGYPVRGAHVETFRFYLGSFAKDHKNCYCTSQKFSGGNGSTFRALNYAYATDGRSVWTMGGKVKDADAESFVVCDDGEYYLPEMRPGEILRVPHGFGKDDNRVFYYDYDGKPNWVRRASPASFVSLNDGFYGKDDSCVFYGAASIPKANVKSWQRIAGFYSKDDARVYCYNRPIREADLATFDVVATKLMQLAKDKNHYYRNEQMIDIAEFEELAARFTE